MQLHTLDRYAILGELGRGAISTVYDARDLLTDDRVALKLIEPSLWAQPTSAAERLRFLTEAMPKWRLRHANIVTVYDAGDADGRVYIAMERLEGTTLRRMLDEWPLPAVPRSLRMAAELASGLAHAHESGVVHRYLKPSNIHISAQGRSKITDFGMAPLRDATLGSADYAASLTYVSPEEIRCDAAIDERSDIFSLGVVLYEMLTGKPPFSGSSADEIMRNVLDVEPPLPSEVNSAVPPLVDLVVWSMLAKHPFDRAPSAEILVRRLLGLSGAVDDALAAPAPADAVAVAAGTTAGRHESDDRHVAQIPGLGGDDRAPSAEIVVRPLRALSEGVDGAPAAHARDEVASAAAGTTAVGRESSDRSVAQLPGGDDRAPSAEIVVPPLRGQGEGVDGAIAAQARDEGASAAAGTTAVGRESSDRSVAQLPGGDDRAPSAEIVVPPLRGQGEGVDGAIAAQARDEGASAAAGTTAVGREFGDRNFGLILGHQGAPQRAKRRLLSYALSALILAAAGGGFLWQWRQASEPSVATSEEPATAVASAPSVSDELRPAAPRPEPGETASRPEVKQAAPEPAPRPAAPRPEPKRAAPASEPKRAAPGPEAKKVASAPEPKKRASKTPAGKPSQSAVASGGTPARRIEPLMPVALATERDPAATLATPAPGVPAPKTATVVFDVFPWGEIYVDGKLRGTTPPLKTLDLPPGRHRIEVRNSARPPHLSYATVEAGDVRRIRHSFD